MTLYGQGFISKCAEYGVDGHWLLKMAGINANETRFDRAPVGLTARPGPPGALPEASPTVSQGSPSVLPEASLPNLNAGESVYTPSAAVRHFFDRLATPGRIRYNKSQGAAKAYDGLLYPGFYNQVDSRVVDRMPSGHAFDDGFASRSSDPIMTEGDRTYYRPEIRLKRDVENIDSTAVHEYTHNRNNDTYHHVRTVPAANGTAMRVAPIGTTGDIRSRLESIYRIGGMYSGPREYDVAVENPTTHAEHQFKWMLKAPRTPSGGFAELPEFEDFVRNTPLVEVKRERSGSVNEYNSDVMSKIKRQYLDEAISAFNDSGVKIPAGRVTVRLNKSDGIPWPGEVSIDDARKSEWYKAAPEFFEEYLSDPRNSKWGISDSMVTDDSLWFDPARLYKDHWMRKYIDDKYGEGTYDTGVSDDEAEKYRDAIINLWSHNGGSSAPLGPWSYQASEKKASSSKENGKSASYRAGFFSKCAEHGLDWPDLLAKSAQYDPYGLSTGSYGADPTDNWASFNPTPSSPSTFTRPSVSHTVDTAKADEAARNMDRKAIADLYVRAPAMMLASIPGSGLGLAGASGLIGAGETGGSLLEGNGLARSVGNGATAGAVTYAGGKALEAVGRHVVKPAWSWMSGKVSPYTNRLRGWAGGLFRGKPAAPGPATARGNTVMPDDVSYFYDDIKLPMKQRSPLAGEPGVDYSTRFRRRGALKEIPVSESSNMPYGSGFTHYDRNPLWEAGGKNGIDTKWNPRIEVARNSPGHTFAHEYDHARNTFNTGISDAEANLLRKTYGFSAEDLVSGYGEKVLSAPARSQSGHALSEMSATNSEHQFMIMKQLEAELGRRPTLDEFSSFLRNSDRGTRLKWRSWKPNVYQEAADARFSGSGYIPENVETFPRKASLWTTGGEPEYEIRNGLYGMYGNTDWYRADPSHFDKLFHDLSRGGGTRIPGKNGSYSIEFDPYHEFFKSENPARQKFSDEDLNNFINAMDWLGQNSGKPKPGYERSMA